MNRETQPSPTNAAGTKRVRSRMDRLVTRSLIAVMLIVVGIEAQARFGHGRTVTQLRKELEEVDQGGKELSLSGARQKISGWTFKTEKLQQGTGRVSYRWPSLFKTYVLHLAINADGDVMSLDTDADAFADEKPAVPANVAAQPGAVNAPGVKAPAKFQVVNPKKGFAQALEGIVAVATQDVMVASMDNDPAKPKVVGGALVRELIRQAFLLSAQEELQQNVRDQSLGDDVGNEDNPQAFPYSVPVDITPTGELKIHITRHRADERMYSRQLPPFQLDLNRFYESLLEHVETLSRSSFPEVLRETGATGKANTFCESADIPPEIETLLHRIDEMSQLAAIRELHALIRRDGESPERLAGLARAYANLGSLTEIHWQLHHKVFKARALLYAQRLVAKTKSSPWSVAHRGYAWTLTGRPQSASEDFRQALDAQAGYKFPRWISDARAYCEYDPAQFASAVDSDIALASYLHLLMADPIDGQTEFLTVAQKLVNESPGCARGHLAICEVTELGLRRMMADGGLQHSWPGIYQILQSATGLPPDAVALIDKHADVNGVRHGEPADRAELIRILKASSDAGPGLSQAVYGRLLDEISFLHAVFRVKIVPAMLGLPADDLVEEIAPTIEGHPYAAYLRSEVSNPETARAEFKKLEAAVKPTDLDFNAQYMIYSSYQRASPNTYMGFWLQALRHQDLIQPDLVRELQYDSQSQRYDLLVHFLSNVAPQLPQAVAQRIAASGLKDAEEARPLETRYDQSPRVLQAIADWYSSRGKYGDAKRCLERRIAIAPEVSAYRSLADVYAWSNERAKWKATLEEALKVPTLGLDHALIQDMLARYYMHRNELEQARPYAEAAAQSYSAWGLTCAALYNERLGKLDRAEALVRACSERYDASCFDWLFWCRRTGRGDETAAKRLAEANLEKYRQFAPAHQFELAIYYLTEKDPAAALAILEKAFNARPGSYKDLHAALIADAQGDAARRDELLTRVGKNWNNEGAYAELADLMTAFLQQPEDAQWNQAAFQRLLYKCGDGDITNYYFFAGRFLDLRGRKDQALNYLQLAASSPQFNKFCCLLAALQLKEREAEIPACRPFELGGELADLTLIRDELTDCRTAQQYDRIVELITQSLVDHPDWSFLLVDRAQAHEGQSKHREAIADYELALDRNPNFQAAHHELAMLRGACEDPAFRDPAQAILHAQRSYDLAITKSYANHTCLAIAHAANGDFDKAVEQQLQAVDIWPDSDKQTAEERLKLFQEQKPYIREPRTP